MKKLFCIMGMMIFSVIAYAQRYDYNWIQGDYFPNDSVNKTNFQIDFNFSPPHVYPIDSKYNIEFTSVTMSDKKGGISFFSNGCWLKNNLFQKIPNSSGFDSINSYFCNFEDANEFQGIFSLPLDSFGRYNIFSLDLDEKVVNTCNTIGLYYSEIDMTKNQGKGKVLKKNLLLKSGCLQAAAANKHANGRDWWVIIGDQLEPKFYRWLVTPSGIEGPMVQEIANPTNDTLFFIGWVEFSPDGNKFLINKHSKGIAVYDFDRCTGLLSNPNLFYDVLEWRFGTVFSPNSRYIYTATNDSKDMIQFDLKANDIANSKVLVEKWNSIGHGSNGEFGYMQHGPDGKLYIWTDNVPFLHVMNYPNKRGPACQVLQYAIKLPSICHGANIYYPNYRLGPIDSSPCDTLGLDNHPLAGFRWDLADTLNPLSVEFTDNSFYEPATWQWNFGDNSPMSTDTNPVHVFPHAGKYQVCLKVCNQFSCDSICYSVLVGESSTAEVESAVGKLLVYPNPTSGLLQVHFPAIGKYSVIVENLLGQTLLQQERSGASTEINLSSIPSGLVLVRVRDASGREAVAKVVVER